MSNRDLQYLVSLGVRKTSPESIFNDENFSRIKSFITQYGYDFLCQYGGLNFNFRIRHSKYDLFLNPLTYEYSYDWSDFEYIDRLRHYLKNEGYSLVGVISGDMGVFITDSGQIYGIDESGHYKLSNNFFELLNNLIIKGEYYPKSFDPLSTTI